MKNKLIKVPLEGVSACLKTANVEICENSIAVEPLAAAPNMKRYELSSHWWLKSALFS